MALYCSVTPEPVSLSLMHAVVVAVRLQHLDGHVDLHLQCESEISKNKNNEVNLEVIKVRNITIVMFDPK